MSEWRQLSLGDAISIKHGYAFKGEFFSDTGPGPLLVTPGNFAVGGGFQQGKRKCYVGPIPDGFRLAPGDVVVTMTDLSKGGDTLGYSAIIPNSEPYLHNQRIGLVQLTKPDLVDHHFVYYVLQTPAYREHVLASATGSTVRHTSPSRICSYSFKAPPVIEQRAIAEVLGALDDKIAVNERIATKVRELATALFKQAVEADAEESEIGTLAEFVSRGVAPRYSEDESELMVLNQKCIRDGRVTLAPARRTLAAKVATAKRLRKNDVLVNSTGVGTLGRVAIWVGNQAATTDSHVSIVRFDAAKVVPLCAGFGMLAAQPEIEMLGEGSTGQTELSRTKLASLRLRMPPRGVQDSLGRQLGELESRGEAALTESQSLTELRDALLPGLMSGTIRVWDAEKAVEGAT